MRLEKTGTRGLYVTYAPEDTPFSYETSLYLVEGPDRVIICDTHCGIASMLPIQAYIAQHMDDKPVTIINTHFDFDHVWGNGAWPHAPIIAHQKCYAILAEDLYWDFFLTLYGDDAHGEVKRCLPNITFSTQLSLPQEHVELIHTPGHTDDSITLHDTQDGILFVADNLETPIPYLQSHHLDGYLNTLAWYDTMTDHTILTAHTGLADQSTIERNADYVQAVQAQRPLTFPDEDTTERHMLNLRVVALSQWEAQARETLGAHFDLAAWLQLVSSSLDQTPLDQLHQRCETFIQTRQE